MELRGVRISLVYQRAIKNQVAIAFHHGSNIKVSEDRQSQFCNAQFWLSGVKSPKLNLNFEN